MSGQIQDGLKSVLFKSHNTELLSAFQSEACNTILHNIMVPQ
jgi:hypothetical protein